MSSTPSPKYGDGTGIPGSPSTSTSPLRWSDYFINGFAFYYLTTIVVVIGVAFAGDFIPRQKHPNQNEAGFIRSFANWDGYWYKQIVQEGYSYQRTRASSVAFFPLYPSLVKALTMVTGVPEDFALLVVSHACLIGVFVLAGAYVKRRYTEFHPDLPDWVLLAVGLFPTTFFMRMAYTESLFMLLLVVALWGMQHDWPLLWIAIIVGLTTACRATGVALVLPLMLYIWQQKSSIRAFVLQSIIYLPLAGWALVAYMAYQYFQFGDPLAFVRTQANWAVRQPDSLQSYVFALATFEPFWSKYDASSVAYWGRHDADINPLFSLEFGNPIYFFLAIALVIVGYWKRWLNGRELLLAAGLLAVPYLTHSFRATMMGHARYASTVFPVYLVMGQLLCRLPSALSAGLLALAALGLGLYSALFASWYRFF